jgi:hypothetical protein
LLVVIYNYSSDAQTHERQKVKCLLVGVLDSTVICSRASLKLLPSEVTPRRGDEGLASTLVCALFNPTHISEYRNRIFYLENKIMST